MSKLFRTNAFRKRSSKHHIASSSIRYLESIVMALSIPRYAGGMPLPQAITHIHNHTTMAAKPKEEISAHDHVAYWRQLYAIH